MEKTNVTKNQEISSLAGVFAQWYLTDNKPKTIDEFLQEASINHIFSKDEFSSLIKGEAHLNEESLPLIKDVLPYKISLPKLNKLNFLAKSKHNSKIININTALFYEGKIGKILKRKQKANNIKKNWRAKNPDIKYKSQAIPSFEANQQRKLIRNADNKIFKLTKPAEYKEKRDAANIKAKDKRMSIKQTNKEEYKQIRANQNTLKRKRTAWLKEHDPITYQHQLELSREAKKRYKENKKNKKILSLVLDVLASKTK